MATYLELIKQCSVFANVSESSLQTLLASGKAVNFKAGMRLFEPNNPCQIMPLVTQGKIRVFSESDNGRELTLYRVDQEQLCILSISCLLGNDRYPASAIAETDVIGIAIAKAAFLQLIAQEASFRTHVFNSFAERITELMLLLDAVTFKKLDQRLVLFILDKGPTIEASHREIADELGSVREIVSRLLKQFEEKGWLSLSRKQISVLDPNQLQAYLTDKV